MKHDIDVRPTGNNREWILRETIYWGNLMVPYGFIFDGASIPIGLRWFFPHGGRKFFAACLHDYLYRNTIGTRKEADKIFLAAMLSNGVPEWKAQTMYYGVRGFGWMSWAKSERGNTGMSVVQQIVGWIKRWSPSWLKLRM